MAGFVCLEWAGASMVLGPRAGKGEGLRQMPLCIKLYQFAAMCEKLLKYFFRIDSDFFFCFESKAGL